MPEVNKEVIYVPSQDYMLMIVNSRPCYVIAKRQPFQEDFKVVEDKDLRQLMRELSTGTVQRRDIAPVRPRCEWPATVTKINDDGTVDIVFRNPSTGSIQNLKGIGDKAPSGNIGHYYKEVS